MPTPPYAQPGDHRTVIVGHYDRRHQAWNLFEQVNAIRMFMDDGRLGAGPNHLNAWQWLSTHNLREWSVVLEDDALPVPGFEDQVRRALAQAPTPVVSLYLGRSRPPHWQDSIARVIADPADPCWLMSDHLLHHVGVAVKTRVLPEMVDSVHRILNKYPIDEAIGRWAHLKRVPIAYTNPSLVDHRWDQLSVIKWRAHNGEEDLVEREVDTKNPRKAWRVGGRTNWESSRLEIPNPMSIGNGYYSSF